MMTTKNSQNENQSTALNDSDLGGVTGGYVLYYDSAANAYYAWEGSAIDDSKYLCPNCKRPVHFGSWIRYYCDPCDASWLKEDWLLPNLKDNHWKRISKEEYERQKGGPGLGPDIH